MLQSVFLRFASRVSSYFLTGRGAIAKIWLSYKKKVFPDPSD